MIVFGIHEFFKPQNWFEYIPPWLEKMSPISKKREMQLHALGNFLFGLFLLINIMPKTAGWIVLIWWISILPFAFRKNWAIGMRDLSIIFSIAAYLVLLYQI
jgi:uncharacterized membrane protein